MINAFLDPIRELRERYLTMPSMVEDILVAGTKRMPDEASETMALVREVMGMYSLPG